MTGHRCDFLWYFFFSQGFFSKLVAAEFIFKVEESILILYIFFNLDVEVRVIQDFVKFKKIST